VVSSFIALGSAAQAPVSEQDKAGKVPIVAAAGKGKYRQFPDEESLFPSSQSWVNRLCSLSH
jgi:hypothetical protein